ncbi:MAG: hypothetical protein E4H03_07880 [Myxococcales bacterium]|nr:MAG: hypothetical protein E4H03_07880 [Myxococcales bacterium]
MRLATALCLAGVLAPEYRRAERSLNLLGHGRNNIERVKIPIDPQVPAAVSGDFILEWWMRADLTGNGNDNRISENVLFDRDVFGPHEGAHSLAVYRQTVIRL